jgi:cysteinyl-tRNA synthetase
MNLELFNTETRTKQTVAPLDGKTVRLYTCGPTVYDFAHIGNWRTFVFEDLLKRALRFFGLPVRHVMNLTDVDDKTIRGAAKNNISLDAFTRRYKEAFFEDLKTLNIEKADCYPEATAYIPKMIAMIEALLSRGFAYRGADGSIYFAISKFPVYGRLSHLKLEELQASAATRSASDEYSKEHIADFVLWKAYDSERDGTVFWQSPFGRGRPGWHIECSVMAKELLGEQIDIHAGGVDLIFPHHENEIAQSEAVSGKPFAKLWIHAEHLLVDHQKMSKSLGNFYTLRDLLGKGFSGRSVRFLLLSTHYRLQQNFTFEALDAATNALARIDDFVRRLGNYSSSKEGLTLSSLLEDADTHFREALADDLNIAEALAVLFELIRKVNSSIDLATLSRDDVKATLKLLSQFDSVLGVLVAEAEEIPAHIEELVRARSEARLAKNFSRSDELRAEIAKLGYHVEDTPRGPLLKKL